MALQNIGASNRNDAFYRYKMPKMITKIEGKGNGIKTNVVNLGDIAKALHRPASYISKYFCYELGTSFKFDEKTGSSVINGEHKTAVLVELLESFIQKYVQCYGCGNPETKIAITKAEMLTLKCAACGFASDVSGAKENLRKFIVKNHVEQKSGAKDKKATRKAEKALIKEAGGEKQKQKISPKVPHSKNKGHISEENGFPNCSAAKENGRETLLLTEQQGKEQLSAIIRDMAALTTAASEECGTKSEIEGHDIDADATKTRQELVNEIKEQLEKGASADQLKHLFSNSSQVAMDALFEVLFEGVGKGFAKEVAKKKNFLAIATQEKGSQIVLLQAIESFFCYKASPEVMKEVAMVLKCLYDCDVVEEDFILEWYEHGLIGNNQSSRIWKNIKPFIDWLQTAESESGE